MDFSIWVMILQPFARAIHRLQRFLTDLAGLQPSVCLILKRAFNYFLHTVEHYVTVKSLLVRCLMLKPITLSIPTGMRPLPLECLCLVWKYEWLAVISCNENYSVLIPLNICVHLHTKQNVVAAWKEALFEYIGVAHRHTFSGGFTRVVA